MAGTLMRRYGWLYSTPQYPCRGIAHAQGGDRSVVSGHAGQSVQWVVLLVRDEGRTSRVITALFIRVTLSALTVALIGWGFYTGQLRPAFGF